MQCNTNYTASSENFKYINLNVLKTYATMFPQVILGYPITPPGMPPCWVQLRWERE
jgi:N-acetylneuraminate synthase